HQLLNRSEFRTEDGPAVIYASIPGPDLVKKALEAGEGATITGEAGAMIDDRFAGPVELTGVVESIHEGDIHAETEVVIRTGSLHVIVTAKRKPYHHESDFTNLGLNPRDADILIVKIGYLVPELYNMRGDWIMALTPGGVDQDLNRLPYKNIRRPMYPLDPDMEDPDLSARLLD
ncbi:MAG: MlrC C-terminal domain-containing protein, partial [Cyclobacteriaceae bacterium]